MATQRIRQLADGLTVARAVLGLPLIVALAGGQPVLAWWLLLARELLISGWRAAEASGGPASWSGKLKTILQFASLLLLLWPNGWGFGLAAAFQTAGFWLFWPSLLLALSSAWGYLRKP